MTKLAVLCFILSHGPSTPIDIAQGNTARAWQALETLVRLELADAVDHSPLTGRFELHKGTDRIALHEECRK